MPIKVSSCAFRSLQQKTPRFVVAVVFKTSTKPSSFVWFCIVIPKHHDLNCHLSDQTPKLSLPSSFRILLTTTDFHGSRKHPQEYKLRGTTTGTGRARTTSRAASSTGRAWPGAVHAAQVGRPGPSAARGPSPGTTTTNGTSPGRRRRPLGPWIAARAGRREGGGSAEELAAPAPHWAPLQTCPSGDRNKVGHKA